MTEDYVALLERQVADLEAENAELRAELNDPTKLKWRYLRLVSGQETRRVAAVTAENDQLRRELARRALGG